MEVGDDAMANLLFQWSIFRGENVSFREGISGSNRPETFWGESRVHLEPGLVSVNLKEIYPGLKQAHL